MVSVLVGSLVLNTVFVLHYCAYIFLADKYAAFLYSKGLLKRCKPSIVMTEGTERKSMRLILENSYNAFFTFYLPIWYLVKTVLPVIDTLDFSFRPIETWISLCGISICFDTWYYFGHKYIHETPWLYKAIHKRHHDMVPIDGYVSGRAEIVENLLLTMPGMFIWAFLYLNMVETPNAWAILIPTITQLHDFVLLHVGYYDSLILYVINPFSIVMQYSLGARHTSARHEQHHNLFTKNYGPMLPWMDRLFGTAAKDPTFDQYQFDFESEKKSAAKLGDAEKTTGEKRGAQRAKTMTFQARE